MNKPTLDPIMSRFADVELLMPESKSSEVQALIAGIAKSEFAKEVMEGEGALAASADKDFWGDEGDDDSYRTRMKRELRPYNVVNGVLQIPIRGVLLNNFPYQFYNYATGYAYIWQAYKRGMEDSAVKGIAFIIHSPGGEVAGNFDLVDRMFDMRGTKPVRAFAHEYAYSAAYSIASVADSIVVSRSGGVGSIGVVTSHVDISKMMDDFGYKITFIHFGKHKVEGNPYEALSDEAKGRIQARIDALGEEFVSIVARNRGMDEKAVRATEALTYPAKEAIQVGLANEIGPLEDALAVFEGDLNQEAEEETMTKTFTQEQYDAAVTSARAEGETVGFEKGKAEGKTEGAQAVQTRMNAVLGSDAAKDRPKIAAKLLSKESLSTQSAEALIELLTDYPKETASAPANAGNGQAFDAAMSGEQHNIEAGAQGGDEAKDDLATTLALAANFSVSGLKTASA